MLEWLRGLSSRYWRAVVNEPAAAQMARSTYPDGGRCHQCGQDCASEMTVCMDCIQDKQW